LALYFSEGFIEGRLLCKSLVLLILAPPASDENRCALAGLKM
jgi:hypothetical protein